MQLLAIDIENAEISVGLFSGEELVSVWKLGTGSRSADEYVLLIRALVSDVTDTPIDAIAIASVVPDVLVRMLDSAEKLAIAPALVIGPGIKTGLSMQVDHPREVGADRVVNAVAAKAMYGSPVIVVDSGAATTIDVVGRDGSFLGGSIAPGIEGGLDSMVSSTAALRRVELVPPKSAVGKTTVEAMQSGLVFGYVAMVDGLVARIVAEMRLGDAPRVATGHMAHVIAELASEVTHVEAALTLRGLKLVYDRSLSQ